jgi:hypothetical protein
MCQKFQATTDTLDLWEEQGCRVMRISYGWHEVRANVYRLN